MSPAPVTPQTALQLPRRGRFGAIAGVVAMGICAIVPIVTAHGPSSAYRGFRAGGSVLSSVVLCGLVAGVAIVVAGWFRVRGARVPGSLLFAAALVPFDICLAGAVSDVSSVTRLISGRSADPAQKIRLAGEHLSASSNLLWHGAVISSALAWAVFVVSAFSVLAIARKSLPTPPRGGRVWVSLAAVFLALTAMAGARILLHVSFTVFDALASAGVLSAAVAAACVPTLRALARSEHDEETVRAWRALLLSAVALSVSVFLVNRAADLRVSRSVGSAISSEGSDLFVRVRVVVEVVSMTKTRWLLSVLDALVCLLVFVPVLGAPRARLKPSAWATLALLFAFGMFGLMGLYALRVERSLEALRPPFEAFERASALVDLPTSPRDNRLDPLKDVEHPLVVVNAVGALASGTFDAELCRHVDERLLLAADKRLGFEALMHLAGPAAPCAVAFVAAPVDRVDPRKLGTFGPLIGSDLRVYFAALSTTSATMDGWLMPPRAFFPPGAALAVLVERESARVAAVTRSDTPSRRGVADRVPLGSDSSSAAERRIVIQRLLTTDAVLEVVLVAPAPTDDVSRVVALLETLRFDDYDLRGRSPVVVLTSDRQGIERLTGPHHL